MELHYIGQPRASNRPQRQSARATRGIFPSFRFVSFRFVSFLLFFLSFLAVALVAILPAFHKSRDCYARARRTSQDLIKCTLVTRRSVALSTEMSSMSLQGKKNSIFFFPYLLLSALNLSHFLGKLLEWLNSLFFHSNHNCLVFPLPIRDSAYEEEKRNDSFHLM